jgi:hypothetical protein
MPVAKLRTGPSETDPYPPIHEEHTMTIRQAAAAFIALALVAACTHAPTSAVDALELDGPTFDVVAVPEDGEGMTTTSGESTVAPDTTGRGVFGVGSGS